MLFNFYASVLALLHIIGLVLAAPITLQLQGRQTTDGPTIESGTNNNNTTVETELVPIVDGTEIDPSLVDLMDQITNYQKQVNEGQPGSPGFDELVQKLNDTKAELNQQISGVAVLVTTTIENSPTLIGSAAVVSVSLTSNSEAPIATTTTFTSVASTTESTISSTVTSPPATTSIDTNVPVVTVVTQVGTSVVVVASQGVTSTVTLATITVQTASPTSSSGPASTSNVASSSSVPGPVASGVTGASSSIAPTIVVSSTPTTTVTVPEVQATSPTGSVSNTGFTAAGSNSGAFSVAPPAIKSHLFIGMVTAFALGAVSLL